MREGRRLPGGRLPGVMSERHVVVFLPEGEALADPRPEVTAKRGVTLIDRWVDRTIGVVGWSTGGLVALRLAEQHPDLPRLVLVSTPFTDDLSERFDLEAVRAKTLLLFGSSDPQTGSKHGRAWQKALPNARLEMVPGGEHDLLEPMWHRVLSHLAPRHASG